jgi:predicted nucleotidyltransferase
MTQRVHQHDSLIYSAGTQIVTLVDIENGSQRVLHPAGAVGVVVRSPMDGQHSYRVKFPDGFEASVKRQDVKQLAEVKEGEIGDVSITASGNDLFQYVAFRCVIGSRAYGLEDENSDTDRRGFYLPPAALHWSLYGVPEQLEDEANQEVYWEIQKFVTLALKANPNVLECLYSPIVELATPIAQELLDQREMFMSRLAYQTFNGYVMSQFKKMQADIRNHGQVKWKHVMHLIRLLISGIGVLRDGLVPVQVGEHRDQLLAIKRGEVSWDEVEKWRLSLHSEFDAVYQTSSLPDRPDYQKANDFLVASRRAALSIV